VGCTADKVRWAGKELALSSEEENNKKMTEEMDWDDLQGVLKAF
jgi:hypothetical protein